jgi:hypothetical protein
MPDHRPLSKARLIAKKRETHRGFLVSWPTNFDADVPISVIALRRVAVAQSIASNTGKSSLTISRKLVGVAAASQRLIQTGERSGLQMRIATTESVSSCTQMKS